MQMLCHESWALASLRCEMLPLVLLLLSVLLLLNAPLRSRLFCQSQRRLEGPQVLRNLPDEVPDGLLWGILDLDDVKYLVQVLSPEDATLDLFHPLADFVAHTTAGVDRLVLAGGFAAKELSLLTAHHHDVVPPLFCPLQGVSRSVSLFSRAREALDISIVLGLDVGESKTRKQLLDSSLTGVPNGMSRKNLVGTCWLVSFDLN